MRRYEKIQTETKKSMIFVFKSIKKVGYRTMKTLYLDCYMSVTGDMLTAALAELLPDPEEFIREVNGIGIPGVCFKREASVKRGISGSRILVTSQKKKRKIKA